MKRIAPVIGVREIRAKMSAYLRAVASGATVTIADRRRRPIARLVPARSSPDDEALEQLANAGIVTRGSGGRVGRKPPVKPRRKDRLVGDYVIEDRR